MAIEKGLDQERVVSQLVDEYHSWKTGRSVLEQEWYELHRAFRSKHPTTRKVVGKRSNRFSPLPHKGAMNIHSQLCNALFPHPNFFQIVPNEVEAESYANAVQHELAYLIDSMGFYGQASSTVLQAVIYGTTDWSLGWNTRYTQETIGMLGSRPLRRRRLVYDGPRLVTRDVFNVVYEPNSHEIPDLTSRWSRTWRPYYYLKMMSEADPETGYKIYENVDELHDVQDHPEFGDDWLVERFETVGIDFSSNHGGRPGGKIEILERWGDIPIEIDGETVLFENYIAVVANRQHLLRFEPNPIHTGAIPLKRFIYQPGDKPADIEGIGALSPGRGLGDLANAVLNGFIDLISKQIRGQYKYLATDRRFDPDNWQDGTNALIPVGIMSNLEPIINDVSLFNMVSVYGLLKQEYQEAIGSTENLTSLKSPVTATEFSGASSIMAGRNRQVVRQMEAHFVEPFLKLLIDFRRQYGSDEIVQRYVTDPENKKKPRWEDIPPEAFDQNFAVRASGSGYIALREERLQQYMMFIQAVGQLPPELLQKVNLGHVIKKVWSEFGFRDDDQVFAGDDPIEQLLRDAGAGGGAGGAGENNAGATASGLGALAPTR